MNSIYYIYFKGRVPAEEVGISLSFRKGCLLLLACLLLSPVRVSAQGLKGSPSQEDLKKQRDMAVEGFEKEKLERMKRNVGKWFIVVRPDSTQEFFENPNALRKKFPVKEKDAFLVVEVVQNEARNMNFYKLKMESGKVLYLSADALYLELKIREGGIARLSKGAGSDRPQQSLKK